MRRSPTFADVRGRSPRCARPTPPTIDPKILLKRDVSVFLRWVLVPLVAQQVERPGEANAEHARVDHLVNEAELGCLVGVGEFRLVVLDEACAGGG